MVLANGQRVRQSWETSQARQSAGEALWDSEASSQLISRNIKVWQETGGYIKDRECGQG